MNEVTIQTEGYGRNTKFAGLVVDRIQSGETIYSIAVTQYGGFWMKGDWITDKYWHFVNPAYLTINYPGSIERITAKIDTIKAWQDSQYKSVAQ